MGATGIKPNDRTKRNERALQMMADESGAYYEGIEEEAAEGGYWGEDGEWEEEGEE